MSRITDQAGFLLDFCKLVQWLTAEGFVVTSGELLRTPEQQAIYVRTGRSKTFNSLHGDKQAGDLNIFKDGRFATREELTGAGVYWESLHPLNSWGGNGRTIVDVPHFSRGINKPEFTRVT